MRQRSCFMEYLVHRFLYNKYMEIKKCSRCKVNERSAYGRYCKKCHSIYHREWRKKNKGYHRKFYESKKTLVSKVILEAKNKPCSDCKNIFPFYVMDFDHISDKSFNIGNARYKQVSHEKLLEEIAKCEVVCANCHRQRTYNRAHGLA